MGWDFKLSDIIDAIESELSMEYWPGAINWADDNQNLAWSKALDRFDKALAKAFKEKDYEYARREGEIYRDAILGLMKQFKAHKNIDDTSNFLNTLRK